jgi:hypothetical protein
MDRSCWPAQPPRHGRPAGTFCTRERSERGRADAICVRPNGPTLLALPAAPGRPAWCRAGSITSPSGLHRVTVERVVPYTNAPVVHGAPPSESYPLLVRILSGSCPAMHDGCNGVWKPCFGRQRSGKTQANVRHRKQLVLLLRSLRMNLGKPVAFMPTSEPALPFLRQRFIRTRRDRLSIIVRCAAFHLKKEAAGSGVWMIFHTLVCRKNGECPVNLYVIDPGRQPGAATPRKRHRKHCQPWAAVAIPSAGSGVFVSRGRRRRVCLLAYPAAGVSPGRGAFVGISLRAP